MHTQPPGPAASLRSRRSILGLLLGGTALAACYTGPASVFTRLTEARRLAADLRVQFHRATDASNRAVMADTDEASLAFAREAEGARQAAHRDVDALRPLFQGLQSSEPARLLGTFTEGLDRYEVLDRAILELAVENTNLKAQRISFGPGRDAADALRAELDAAVAAATPRSRCRAESLAAGAALAVREIQVLQAPHIAEAKDAEMTRMEQAMDERAAAARRALQSLGPEAGPGARERLGAAAAALQRFLDLNKDLIALSRRNSNVRSLAMSLGEKREVTAACEASLAALQESLADQETKPSR